MKQPKKQTRLSMKLLWQLRGDFCLTETNGKTQSQDLAMEYTRRFLHFVDQSINSNAKSAKPTK